MSKLSLQAVLEVLDKASKPLKEIQDKARKLTASLDDQQATLKKLNRTQADITSFKRLSSELGQTRNAMKEAQQRAQQLAQTHAAIPKPTRAMAKELERARLAVKNLKQAEQDQVQHMQRLRQSLTQAGISTRNLGNDEKRLQAQILNATNTLKRKKAALEQVAKIQRQYATDQERISKLSGMGMNAGMKAAAGTAAMLVPVKFSVDFESAMADVKKVVDFDTPDQFKKMSDDVLQLSKRLPMAASEIATIVASGGQSGIAKSELLRFAEDAVKMGVAFDITAEESGQAMAEMRTAFKMSQDEVTALSDKINYLGNNTPAAAKGIMAIVQRIGPLGEVGGFASGSIAALGATIRGMGTDEEIAATGIQNMMLALVAGESATKSQKNAFKELGLNSSQVAKNMQKDAEGTTLAVLKAVRKLPKDQQAAMLQSLFGKESIKAIAPLLTNMEALEKNLDMVSDKTKYAGSMQAEYASRAATTANNWQLFKNKLAASGITIGNTLLPAINSTLSSVGNLVDKFQLWAAQHPVLVGNMSKAAVFIIALVAAFSALSLGLLTILGPMALLRLTFGVLGAKGFGLISIMKMAGGAAMWLGRTIFAVGRLMLTNPLFLAITLLAVAAYMIYRNWEPIKQFFIGIWSSISSGAGQLWQSIQAFFSSGIANITATIINWSPLGVFYHAFASVMSWFGVQLPATFTGFGQMLMQGLGNGIISAVGSVIEKAKAAAAQVTGTVKSAFGIHSPSRVFAQLGAYNMQGLALGIDSNSKLPAQSIKNASQDMLGVFDTAAPLSLNRSFSFDRQAPLTASPLSSGMSTAPVVQQTFNIYPSAGMDEQALARLVAMEVAKAQRAAESAQRRSFSDL